ncbi:DUF983 domain-containing protein [Chelatococcus sp. GCM10030263]|uniref:DUF983 domain-containing protein n=1 Tax=Chelatococcus sp. GCM10030263 TaxID=3273387 RepID=UPI0036173495
MAAIRGLTDIEGMDEKRAWWPAIKKGFACRCPSCGEGRLFSSFLKVERRCAACSEDLSAERADDLPPYIVISVVGHVVVSGILVAEAISELPLWMHMVVWPLMTLVLCLLIMQPVKGAVVAHQWAMRMHGFGDETENPVMDRVGGRLHDAR